MPTAVLLWASPTAWFDGKISSGLCHVCDYKLLLHSFNLLGLWTYNYLLKMLLSLNFLECNCLNASLTFYGIQALKLRGFFLDLSYRQNFLSVILLPCTSFFLFKETFNHLPYLIISSFTQMLLSIMLHQDILINSYFCFLFVSDFVWFEVLWILEQWKPKLCAKCLHAFPV